MVKNWSIEGHAIVSADDRIAGADGRTPSSLRNDADWARFQAALDRAAITILGRRSHEANPNHKRRRRLVLSASVDGIERRDDAWWWNPAQVAVDLAMATAAGGGGIAVVPGGCRVFDLFLSVGFDAFHLARAEKVRIPDGVPVFSDVLRGQTANAILSAHGLRSDRSRCLDEEASVSVSVWRPGDA